MLQCLGREGSEVVAVVGVIIGRSVVRDVSGMVVRATWDLGSNPSENSVCLARSSKAFGVLARP